MLEVPVISEFMPSEEAVLDLEPDLVYSGWESAFAADAAGERENWPPSASRTLRAAGRVPQRPGARRSSTSTRCSARSRRWRASSASIPSR